MSVNLLAFIRYLDDRSLLWLNSFMGRWPLLDQIVGRLLGTDELKFGVMVAVFYWLWFRYEPPDQRKRAILAMTAVASVVGLVVTRVLVILLPFRERPLSRPELHFHLPLNFDTGLRT
jgi:hypothetical protein